MFDTIVVPMTEDGFQRVFIGERRWYFVRISAARAKEIKFVAAYRVTPTSAITHVASVLRIEKIRGSVKQQVIFQKPAWEIRPIPRRNLGVQSMRYTRFSILVDAKTIDDLWYPEA